MNNLMLDLETLSSSNNGAIIQIGACYFDWNGIVGDTFLVNVKPDTCFDINIDTVMWWLTNQDSVIKSLLPNQVSLSDGLIKLNDFSKAAEHIWSHATFDFVLLMNAYDKLKIKKPFGFRASRDIRTLVSLAGITYRHQERADQHNALADCIFQAEYCTKAFKELGKEKK